MAFERHPQELLNLCRRNLHPQTFSPFSSTTPSLSLHFPSPSLYPPSTITPPSISSLSWSFPDVPLPLLPQFPTPSTPSYSCPSSPPPPTLPSHQGWGPTSSSSFAVVLAPAPAPQYPPVALLSSNKAEEEQQSQLSVGLTWLHLSSGERNSTPIQSHSLQCGVAYSNTEYPFHLFPLSLSSALRSMSKST